MLVLISVTGLGFVGRGYAPALCWGALRGARFASQTACVLTLAFAVSLYWLILKPAPDPGNPAPFATTRSTGNLPAARESPIASSIRRWG